MTKEDIVKAAFKAWGREHYRTTSLSQIARELGVSKPALYRHFKDKDALLEEMYSTYFDNFSDFIRESYEKAVAMENKHEGGLLIMRTLAEYYMRNREAFTFSLVKVYSVKEAGKIRKEFFARGLNLELLSGRKKECSGFPSIFHLIMVTLIFSIAQFHKRNEANKVSPSEEMIKQTVADIETHVMKGLRLNAGIAVSLDYDRLERQAAETKPREQGDSGLLLAVAAAVAEAGPLDVSMEMVAQRSGLSKSGLYAHFKNKKDMLGKLFIKEFSGIISSAKMQVEASVVPEEQLYLGIISVANYLRSRPELLMSMEWLKTRRLNMLNIKKEAIVKLESLIRCFNQEIIMKQDSQFLLWIAQWILFMIIGILAWGPAAKTETGPINNPIMWAKKAVEIPNESFRVLFRFAALGLEGFTCEQ